MWLRFMGFLTFSFWWQFGLAAVGVRFKVKRCREPSEKSDLRKISGIGVANDLPPDPLIALGHFEQSLQ